MFISSYFFSIVFNFSELISTFFLEKVKTSRFQQQIKSDLSPKYTEMKTGARISRFGRKLTETKQDASSIPTEIAKFIPKNSPKRIKPKEVSVETDEILKENLQVLKEVEKVETEPEIALKTNSETLEVAVTEKAQMSEAEEREDSFDVNYENSAIVGEETSEQTVTEEVPTVSETVEVSDKNCEETQTNKSTVNIEADKVLQISATETMEGHRDDVSDTSSAEKSKQDFSDTDSALGSCSDHKDEDFYAGQILWGSFSGFTWYPCMAFPYDEEGNIIERGSYILT